MAYGQYLYKPVTQSSPHLNNDYLRVQANSVLWQPMPWNHVGPEHQQSQHGTSYGLPNNCAAKFTTLMITIKIKHFPNVVMRRIVENPC